MNNIINRYLGITALAMMVLLGFSACSSNSENTISVENNEAFYQALKNVETGQEIVLAEGIWKDLAIELSARGRQGEEIIIRAETPGKVFLEGNSYVKFGGSYLILKDLVFRNGYTPEDAVISFRDDEGNVADNCRVSSCVIVDYTQPDRKKQDHWVAFWGRHNVLENSFLAGKVNRGPTVRVFLKGNESINTHHSIRSNHFGPRPRKGGPRGETMQIGNSGTSMTPSYVMVENNFFDRCNGEVEVISSKSNFNEFRNNIFYLSEGSLVTRHGNYCRIDGNIFIGSEENPFIGGLRIINTGHWVMNNYFYKLRSEEFRAPLAIMNGIPKSPLNRYNQVTDVVVAYNTWVDCVTPWHISVGANNDKKDVLPASEIRSARPERTLIANNLIYSEDVTQPLMRSYDKVDGIRFEKNIINTEAAEIVNTEGVRAASITMEKSADGFPMPGKDEFSALQSDYTAFGFDEIREDLFGNDRSRTNIAGAMIRANNIDRLLKDPKEFGPEWYDPDEKMEKTQKISIDPNEKDLAQAVENSASGDSIVISPGNFELRESLTINKKLNIIADENVTVTYIGSNEKALFIMQPYAELFLSGIDLKGNGKNTLFATPDNNNRANYELRAENLEIRNFAEILKVHKGSFADVIRFENVDFTDCSSGFQLAAETDDKGDYNAEFLAFENCRFKNISSNVINYYRGGYDESTIGGNLMLNNCEFHQCGTDDRDNMLIKSHGIINVAIENNSFIDNPVKLTARLWGEKNNSASDNTINNSGTIETVQHLKQKLMY